MKKLVLLIIILTSALSFTTTANAQKAKKQKKINLWGSVIDAKTKAGPDSVFLTLMRADSSVVDTTSAKKWESDWQMRASTSYEFKVPAEPAKYIIRAEADGYYPNTLNYEIKKVARNTWFELPMIKLRPRKVGVPDSMMLDEVVVKATRIKMVRKGDTLVYNADAFPLEEGSMLDALVKQLPGAKLSSDGEITVNGEKVEELTLNGKDFFKGNNKVMLENLPSFTVKNIQVFHKSSKESKWAGRELEQKKFTMDVQLKRQYNTGFLGNVEVAGGTEDRYLARLFAMRYTDCSRLSVYANMNNVNENRKPGEKGDWEPSNQPQGEQVTRKVGADLHISEKEEKWEESASAELSWDKSVNEAAANAEQFLSTKNSFFRSMSSSTAHNKSFSVENDFNLYKPFYLNSGTYITYSKQDNTSLSRSASSDENLEQWGSVQASLDSIFASQLNTQLQARLINRNSNNSLGNSSSLFADQSVNIGQKLSNGDMLQCSLQGRYSKTKSENYNLQNVNYYRTDNADLFQNKYNTTPSSRYRYYGNLRYTYNISSNFSIAGLIGYKQEYEKQDKQYYRLDAIEGWGQNSQHTFGELPSNRNELLLAIDAQNTYQGYEMQKELGGTITTTYQNFNDSLACYGYIELQASSNNDRLSYHSTILNTIVKQKNFFLKPSAYFYYNNRKTGWLVQGSLRYDISAPSLYNMVDVRNDTDPLNIKLGNPDLKNTSSESASITIGKLWKGENEINNRISISGTANQNSISQGYTYNTTTGGNTYKPVNVNGNWNCSFGDFLNISFGKGKRWNYNNNLSYSLAQSVDMASIEGQDDSGLNKVHNNTLTDDMDLTFKLDENTSFGINGNVTYRHTTSDQESFTTINATNFSYGFTGTYRIPWVNCTIATDIKMFSRRGYASSDLNTNDLVWNASISKGFLKKKLIARLEAFDLLHQLTNTTITINAQGRAETITNTLPRYAMLHLQYNFNLMPKMKKK